MPKAKNRTPDLRFDFYFVPYGYQIDVFDSGKEVGGECRDFGGSYPIKSLKKKFGSAMVKAINKTRSKL